MSWLNIDFVVVMIESNSCGKEVGIFGNKDCVVFLVELFCFERIVFIFNEILGVDVVLVLKSGI